VANRWNAAMGLEQRFPSEARPVHPARLSLVWQEIFENTCRSNDYSNQLTSL